MFNFEKNYWISPLVHTPYSRFKIRHFVYGVLKELNCLDKFTNQQIQLKIENLEPPKGGYILPIFNLDIEYKKRFTEQKFLIVINSDKDVFWSSLAHELVHLKQYLFKELSNSKNGMIWKSNLILREDIFSFYYKCFKYPDKHIFRHLPRQLPWEAEAYQQQEYLAFIGNHYSESKINDSISSSVQG